MSDSTLFHIQSQIWTYLFVLSIKSTIKTIFRHCVGRGEDGGGHGGDTRIVQANKELQ
jgi:hypothetical protein